MVRADPAEGADGYSAARGIDETGVVRVGVLALQRGEQRRADGDQHEQGDDARRRDGGALSAHPPPERPVPGGGGRSDGPRLLGRSGVQQCFRHGYLTATWEMSSTPVQSLITTFLMPWP